MHEMPGDLREALVPMWTCLAEAGLQPGPAQIYLPKDKAETLYPFGYACLPAARLRAGSSAPAKDLNLATKFNQHG